MEGNVFVCLVAAARGVGGWVGPLRAPAPPSQTLWSCGVPQRAEARARGARSPTRHPYLHPPTPFPHSGAAQYHASAFWGAFLKVRARASLPAPAEVLMRAFGDEKLCVPLVSRGLTRSPGESADAIHFLRTLPALAAGVCASGATLPARPDANHALLAGGRHGRTQSETADGTDRLQDA